MRTLLMATLLLALMGCATGPIGQLPRPQLGQEVGEVVILRNRNVVGSAVSYHIIVNGTIVFGIRVGQHTIFRLAQGIHRIGVRWFGGWFPMWMRSVKEFEIVPHQRIYLLVSPSFWGAEIEKISEKDGKMRLGGSEYIGMPQ